VSPNDFVEVTTPDQHGPDGHSGHDGHLVEQGPVLRIFRGNEERPAPLGGT
jgi:hypothetical protein